MSEPVHKPRVAPRSAAYSKDPGDEEKVVLTRRGFFKIAGIFLAGAAVAACEGRAGSMPPLSATPLPTISQYPDIPFAPAEPPPANVLVVFSPHEAQTVEALTGRIFPGDPSDPGAREAGVTNYIDKMLAFNQGYVEYTYTQPPFAKTYEGDQPPPPETVDGYQVVWVKKSEIDRYGFQSNLTPAERYHSGLSSVDQYSNKKYGSDFVDLSADQQDQVLTDMEKGEADDVFKDPTAKDFFKLLQDHTVQGMFSDPAYGGNVGMVGWQLIGYPGSQRAYTPVDMNTEGPVRPPQSLAMLHRFHSGQHANPNVILPQSGSNLPPKFRRER